MECPDRHLINLSIDRAQNLADEMIETPNRVTVSYSFPWAWVPRGQVLNCFLACYFLFLYSINPTAIWILFDMAICYSLAFSPLPCINQCASCSLCQCASP